MEEPELSPLQQLFDKAKEHGGFEYLYALVRIDGIQCHKGYKDELVALRDWLSHPDVSDLVSAYRHLVCLPEPLELLQNLLNCANGKHYQVRAFIHLKKGKFPNYVWPGTLQKVESLIENARTSGFAGLAEQIEASYPRQLLEESASTMEEVRAAFGSLSKLLKQE